MGGPGRGEANDHGEQIGEPDQRGAGGIPAQDAELGAHGGHPAAGGGASGGGQEEPSGQPVPVSLPQDRRDVESGRHRAAPQVTAAGGGDRRRSEIPRPASHIRYDGPAQRCGRKNGVQYVGSLQRGIHAGHLHPCDCPDAAGRGG